MRVAKEDSGQILILVAIILPVLLLFTALAVDVGMAYITKANLSKSADAACLTGMKNLWQGHDTATTLAKHIFKANYGANPPEPVVTFPSDSYGNLQVQVTATTTVPTFFAQSALTFWTVSNTAIATRGRLVMALVLDNSGSMGLNKGGPALKTAVPIFINYFDDSVDYAAMISYDSNASVPVTMRHTFKSLITSAVGNFDFNGATFGTGGTYVASDGPPLTLADNQINTIAVVSGQNLVRVAVYFTDGKTNTLQDTFSCPASKLINFGGHDSDNGVDVLDPTSGTDWGTIATSGTYKGVLLYGNSLYCKNGSNYVTTFYSQQYKVQEGFTADKVTPESEYRALQTGGVMNAETPGTYIYTIGLGNAVNATFLTDLANDPASSKYNANLPAGQYFPVPDCSSSTTQAKCTQELQTAFQTIAAKVLLRLTQ